LFRTSFIITYVRLTGADLDNVVNIL